MKKTVLALFAALIVILTAPATAGAQIIYSGECGARGDNLTWTLDDTGTLTITGEGDMEDYGPSSIHWYNASEIRSVIIDAGASSIGEMAFYYCSSIRDVTIPYGVTSIGDRAFYNCSSLKSVTIPDSTVNIGYGAFGGCSSLREITIPSGVTSIGDSMFSDCESLTDVTIPKSVTSIDYRAFSGCESLTDVYYGGSEDDWNNIDIGFDNDFLTDAEIHFNYTPSVQVPPASLTVEPAGGGYRLTAETELGGTAYAAVYDAAGALSDAAAVPFENGTATVSPDISGAAEIKFFVWTDALRPVTDTKTITF